MTLPILVNSVPLFSKEQVSLYLVGTEHAALPREKRWGTGRTERAGEISYPPEQDQATRTFSTYSFLHTNQRGKALNPPTLQLRGTPKEQCPFLLTSQVWKQHAKRLVRIPYHAVQPSSEAQHLFCSMEGCARSCTEQRKRKMEEMGRRLGKVRRNVSGSLTRGSPPSARTPISLDLTGHLFLAQRLVKRLQQAKQGIVG